MVPFCSCCNYATVGHTGMQIFNSVVLSGIAAPRNVLTSHISKTHLSVVSPHLRELELTLKRPTKKKGRLPCARTRARVCVCTCVRYVLFECGLI